MSEQIFGMGMQEAKDRIWAGHHRKQEQIKEREVEALKEEKFRIIQDMLIEAFESYAERRRHMKTEESE